MWLYQLTGGRCDLSGEFVLGDARPEAWEKLTSGFGPPKKVKAAPQANSFFDTCNRLEDGVGHAELDGRASCSYHRMRMQMRKMTGLACIRQI